MYSLIRHAPKSGLLSDQGPALIIAFAIASFFYKFGSFALECLAFLATWFFIDLIFTSVHSIWAERRRQVPADRR